MSAAAKKIEQPRIRPAGPDEKTGDIPVALLEQLKKEQTTITAEIEKAKVESQTQAVKKQDESTKIFNLRQAQLVQRIRDLEARRMRTEKELREIDAQKNSTLHADLKKATVFLVNETKKLAPLEKEIEAGVSKINTLRNEMQALLETSNDERKKNQGAFETQSRDIQALTDMVKACTSAITVEFRKVKEEIDPLLKQKTDLILKLTQLKDECAVSEAKMKTIDARLTDMDRTLIDKSQKVDSLEQQAVELSATEWKLNAANSEIIDLVARKEVLLTSIAKSESQLLELHNSGRRIEASLSFLHDQYEKKKDHLNLVEKEVLESRHQIDLIKKEEIHLLQSCAHLQSTLNQVMQEVTVLTAQKAAALQLQTEAAELYTQKRDYYLREVKTLEENFNFRKSQMDLELATKIAEWEAGFKIYSEQKEAALTTELEFLRQQHLNEWASQKGRLLSGVHQVLSKQVSRATFATADQKTEEMGHELEKVLTDFFTPQVMAGKMKQWWKFW